jgi:hypothetical protein
MVGFCVGWQAGEQNGIGNMQASIGNKQASKMVEFRIG